MGPVVADSATIDALRESGLTERSLELMQRGDPGALPLSQAVIAAQTLDCSLSYLTHATAERGRRPAEHVRFDHFAYVRRRKEVGLEAERVRQVLGLSPRGARRLALGTFDPTIGQVMLLESVLLLTPGVLLS